MSLKKLFQNVIIILRKCGYKCITNYRSIKKRIKLLNLDTSHFKKYKPIENKKNNINDILIKDSLIIK